MKGEYKQKLNEFTSKAQYDVDVVIDSLIKFMETDKWEFDLSGDE